MSDDDISDDNDTVVDDMDEDTCLMRGTRCFLWLTLGTLFTSSSCGRFDMVVCCKNAHVSVNI